jgi:hypothetical protein
MEITASFFNFGDSLDGEKGLEGVNQCTSNFLCTRVRAQLLIRTQRRGIRGQVTSDMLPDADLFFVLRLHDVAGFGVVVELRLEVESCSAVLAVELGSGETEEGSLVGDA